MVVSEVDESCGSSPRLRGTLIPSLCRVCCGRFIPAPAGNTAAPARERWRLPVHPRACGEHKRCRRDRDNGGGSSPRLRGTRPRHVIPARVPRFIPAPAGNTPASHRTRRTHSVHPRACGEHRTDRWGTHAVIGSSPRLRGTRAPRPRARERPRFIPAPVGNTPAKATCSTRPPVHPRACGEHDLARVTAQRTSGSSPRLRGTRRAAGHRAAGQRFIPAPAGNTGPDGRKPPGTTVHPRACGEHLAESLGEMRTGGSSPRLRGTREAPRELGVLQRFIPAPAGNTSLSCQARSASAVHPRACGEHRHRVDAPPISCGSSPRLRGTRFQIGAHLGLARFIPAPAGNTRRSCRQTAAAPVHPRACGEHVPHRRAVSAHVGSSPRLRGTRPVRGTPPAGRRFIPAPAGNTRCPGRPTGQAAVHPRACGEHGDSGGSANGRDGSSPRLRGTRQRAGLAAGLVRFIPAPAGNTRRRRQRRARSTVHPRACGEHACHSHHPRFGSGSSPRLRGTLREFRPRRRAFRFIPAPAGNTELRRARLRQQAVHPRACGEHHAATPVCWVACGSSPRLRGTRDCTRDC